MPVYSDSEALDTIIKYLATVLLDIFAVWRIKRKTKQESDLLRYAIQQEFKFSEILLLFK